MYHCQYNRQQALLILYSLKPMNFEKINMFHFYFYFYFTVISNVVVFILCKFAHDPVDLPLDFNTPKFLIASLAFVVPIKILVNEDACDMLFFWLPIPAANPIINISNPQQQQHKKYVLLFFGNLVLI